MTNNGQLHEVSLKIGELLANVEQLAQANHSARRDRAAMQERLDQVVTDVGQLKNDVSDMKPSVQRYNSDRSRDSKRDADDCLARLTSAPPSGGTAPRSEGGIDLKN